MSSVPKNIYVDIFTRLQVKSLLTCKCVCKTWFQIISSSSFVNKHLNYAKRRNNSLMINDWSRGKDFIYSISCEVLGEIKDNLVEIDYPHKSLVDSHSLELVGSCSGLVCLSWKEAARKFLCLWNPATKEYKIIPNSSNKNGSHDECFMGGLSFGYDHKADDYKVIRIVRNVCEFKVGSLVDVYTLKSNSWKSYQTVPYSFDTLDDRVLVHGALHWFGRTSVDHAMFLISFHIGDENFNEVPQTKELSDGVNRCLSRTMGVLDECLCVVVENMDEVCFDVWVMQEYGVRESWTKRHIISNERTTKFGYLKPVWSFEKGGEIVFSWGGGNLVLYNPKHESVQELDICGLGVHMNYSESLVSLVGEN